MTNHTPTSCGKVLSGSDADRFWSKVVVGSRPYETDELASARGDCWLWNGIVRRNHRYPIFRYHGGYRVAHRLAFEDAGHHLRDGMVIDHLCRVHTCVNPKHLEQVTHLENVQRGHRGNVTHCKNGHEFTEENTKISFRNGRTVRVCRTCLAKWRHEQYQRTKMKKSL